MLIKLMLTFTLLLSHVAVSAQSRLLDSIGTEEEYQVFRQELQEGVTLSEETTNALMNALATDALDDRSQFIVARRLAETNDPQIIRRLIETTAQNSRDNGDNRVVRGLTYSQDPQVRSFMINIISNNQAGIDDKRVTASSPEGYAAGYLTELAEQGDTEVIDVFKSTITSNFIQDSYSSVSIMSSAIANRGNPEDIQFLTQYLSNPNHIYSRAVIEAISESPASNATQALVGIIESSSGENRIHAVKYLGQRIEENLGNAGSNIQAINALVSEYQSANRELKDEIVGALLKTSSPQDNLSLFTDHLTRGRSEQIEGIANLISEHSTGNDPAFTALSEYISTHTQDHKDIAETLANNSSASQSLNLLHQITTLNNDPEINYIASKAFLETNDPKYLPVILRSLEYDRNYKKEEIIAFVVEHGEPTDYLALFDLLGDENRSVRLAAFDAISQMMRETLTETQFEQLIACLNQPRFERSETMFLIAALTDITLSYAARTEANIGISAYNSSRGTRTMEAVSPEQIESLKSVFLTMIN